MKKNPTNDDAIPLEEGEVYESISHAPAQASSDSGPPPMDIPEQEASVHKPQAEQLPYEEQPEPHEMDIDGSSLNQFGANPDSQLYDQPQMTAPGNYYSEYDQNPQQYAEQSPDQQAYQDAYGAYESDAEYPSTPASYQDQQGVDPQQYQYDPTQQPLVDQQGYPVEEHPFIAPQLDDGGSSSGSSRLFAWYALRIGIVLVVLGLLIGGGIGIYRAVNPKKAAQVVSTEDTGEDNQELYEGDGSDISDTQQPSSAWKCEKGYKADSDDETLCLKNATKTVNVKKTFSCPTGYTKYGDGEGTTCQKVTGASHTLTASVSTSYSCSSGYQRSGKSCKRTVTKAAQKVYSCASGYTQSGSGASTTCKKTVVSYGTVGVRCASGYSREGSGINAKCKRTVAAKKNTTYTCPTGFNRSGTVCRKWVKQNKAKKCPSGYVKRDGKCLRQIKATSHVSYTCTAGYTRSGTSCFVYGNPDYYCPSGYAESGSGTSTRCKKIAVYTRRPSVKSVCSSGYSLSGSTCRKTETTSAAAHYSCPSGYGRSGSKCYKTVGGTVTSASPKVKRTCPSGYDLLSSKEECSKTSNSEKPAKMVETCDDGWELLKDEENGSQCVKTANDDSGTEGL